MSTTEKVRPRDRRDEHHTGKNGKANPNTDSSGSGSGVDKLARTKPSIVPQKEVKADVRRFEKLLAEVGMVLALGLLVGLFRLPMNFEEEFVIQEVQQAVVEMEEIEQTTQVDKPPPPPRPPVPIEVPNESVLEDEVLDIDAEIDLDEPVDVPPPPPPPEPREEEVEQEIFMVVEEMPELIGGTKSIYEALHYPELAIKAGIEGTVVVQFVIEPDGSPTNPKILKSAGDILDKEALAAVEKLRFRPGKQRGKPVRVRFALPIRFQLRDAQSG